MKILVMSDTHKKTKRAEDLIKYYVMHEGIGCVIHCGDHLSDAKSLAKVFPEITFYKVPGNCDSEGFGSSTDLVVDIEGVNIYIAHGHKHHVKGGYEDMIIDAQAHGAHMGIFGHTHSALKDKREGIVLLNPGSLSEPRDTTYPSFAVVEIENGVIKNVEVKQLVGKDRFMSHPYF